MNKHLCDKCKNEISPESPYGYIQYRFLENKPYLDDATQLDFCEICTKEFFRWWTKNS